MIWTEPTLEIESTFGEILHLVETHDRGEVWDKFEEKRVGSCVLKFIVCKW